MAKVVKTIKIQKEQGVKLCEDMLVDNMAREEILQQITKKYKISVGAIDKWIKTAKPNAEKRRKEDDGRKERAEIERQGTIEATKLQLLKEGLVTDLELEVFLCRIAIGGIDVSEMAKGIQVIRDVSPIERMKAVEILFKKRGSNASSKVELSGDVGVQLFKFGFNDERSGD